MKSHDLHRNTEVADESTIQNILRKLGGPDEEVLRLIKAATSRYPGDARLPFLRGSVLAQAQRHDEAREHLASSVRLAPALYPAWFMLGLLDIGTGNLAQARHAWQPLSELGPDNALVLFARGLLLLAEDDFEGAASSFQDGLARNGAYPEITRYIEGILIRLGSRNAPGAGEAMPIDARHYLLGGYLAGTTRH
jgi:tetratricopeptide (TPR) repeat protein